MYSPCEVFSIPTIPYKGQKAGTSGLRAKVKIFTQDHYLQNFLQSIFDALPPSEYLNKSLVISGDGRYYNNEAIQIAIRMAAGNGISKVICQEGKMSTPAISALIRKLNLETPNSCAGGIILTASHNPGGENEDFGVKFNTNNGGPALEDLTGLMHKKSESIREFKIVYLTKNEINIKDIGIISFPNIVTEKRTFTVEIINNTENYVNLMKSIFCLEDIKKLIARKDFKMVFDGMHGASGPYAIEIFHKILGVPIENLFHCDQLPNFGGHHPDPNLTYAEHLVKVMGLNDKEVPSEIPDFGAACDGDADRNMIVGKKFFVTPYDSLAVIAANVKSCVHYFKNGITGLSRSMATSLALSFVAKELGLKEYEVPTGWKFFGNLMDKNMINICGEESFGTGSDHIREKDGIWAILCWLSILAFHNKDREEGKLKSVEEIVKEHWTKFGRNYYCRYDFENVPKAISPKFFENLTLKLKDWENVNPGNSKSDIFKYVDPVDGKTSDNQGHRFILSEGTRFVFRLSGTSTEFDVIRLYLETYKKDFSIPLAEALKEITQKALEFSEIQKITGKDKPDVIT